MASIHATEDLSSHRTQEGGGTGDGGVCGREGGRGGGGGVVIIWYIAV